MKRTVHMPINTERYTTAERSLSFITAMMPVIKAMMLAGKETATVTSHQWSLKFSTFRIKTSTQEILTAIKKNAFSPTDHLPNLVVSIKFVFIILFEFD